MYNIDEDLRIKILKKAKAVFLNPKTYSYTDIVSGQLVTAVNGESKRMYPVETNTTMGFGFKNMKIVMNILIDYFLEHKDDIIAILINFKSRKELNYFEDEICEDLIISLENQNILVNLLEQYNKIRKLVDLYIYHIVCMSNELSKFRCGFLQFLFLPLDGQMFKKVFSKEELRNFHLHQSSTYGCLKYREDYIKLQDIVDAKAQLLCKNEPFYPIYFDLLWGKNKDKNKNARYESWGNNIYETNFGIPL